MSKPKPKNELSHADALAEAQRVYAGIVPPSVCVKLRPWPIDMTAGEYAKRHNITRRQAGEALNKATEPKNGKPARLTRLWARVWNGKAYGDHAEYVYYAATLPPPSAE